MTRPWKIAGVVVALFSVAALGLSIYSVTQINVRVEDRALRKSPPTSMTTQTNCEGRRASPASRARKVSKGNRDCLERKASRDRRARRARRVRRVRRVRPQCRAAGRSSAHRSTT